MKEHEIREFVNELTATARAHGGCQSLREALADVVKKRVAQEPSAIIQDNKGWDALYGINRG